MKAVVIDTNVLDVANERAAQAGPDCVLACLDALDEARKRQVVLLDLPGLILEEYLRHSSFSGQPGAGNAFFKWLWDNQGFESHCQKVSITPRGSDQTDFDEFPSDPALASFDPSDRKFVAVVRASRHRPKVLNATDTDWWRHRVALKRNGIVVAFLCRDLMR